MPTTEGQVRPITKLEPQDLYLTDVEEKLLSLIEREYGIDNAASSV
ncbi:MAG: hypothetical protein V7K40_33080 [Nostoc sp.]